jgi:hypothetical protein
MLGCIVGDMIRAGPSGYFGDGTPKINGIVIGFMGVLNTAVALAWRDPATARPAL